MKSIPSRTKRSTSMTKRMTRMTGTQLPLAHRMWLITTASMIKWNCPIRVTWNVGLLTTYQPGSTWFYRYMRTTCAIQMVNLFTRHSLLKETRRTWTTKHDMRLCGTWQSLYHYLILTTGSHLPCGNCTWLFTMLGMLLPLLYLGQVLTHCLDVNKTLGRSWVFARMRWRAIQHKCTFGKCTSIMQIQRTQSCPCVTVLLCPYLLQVIFAK